MEIRHQVFVSSTYVDLVEERQAIIQALLELECIPAGMELFVATDQDQWDLIKAVIDLSDYYLLIIGARYGHVTEENISYTEKEYNYAVEQDKPIVAFVHGNPDTVPQGVTDKDNDKAEKLAAFRERVRNGSDGKRRNVGEFKTADELAAKVSRAISIAMRKYPGVGWVRGDQAMTVETQKELLDLKKQIDALESEKAAAQSALVEDINGLAQGSDIVTLELYVSDESYPVNERKKTIFVEATTTWDDLLRKIGPIMIDEAPEKDVRTRLSNYLFSNDCLSREEIEKILALGVPQGSLKWALLDASWDIVSIQLRALDLIEPGSKKRQIQDKTKYLGLTTRGQKHLMKLRAAPGGVDPGKDNDAESNPDDDSEPELDADT
ncbi:DUF4062 domain-containing protein [Mycolicibacterium neoaurum]|uniref:DUF4062 domain-containing protein n=1 Tax=Mycolicibacterium neoaurum TaxID=1795 RepID=UPI00267208BD|nr:DUF4062 domain-containing protein [Mycolicibacterium neoaurum]MDO3398670.1 DUF4062 domain-containing protein [Mycolicibacterium neoaurum]